MESKKTDWQRVREKPLGEGGQSKVYLVRTPERTRERLKSLAILNSHIYNATSTDDERLKTNIEYLDALRNYLRSDKPEELGAMKEFKLRDDEEQSLRRLQQEIEVLAEKRPGLPKLLGSNIDQRWMVTEFFPNGTLEDHLLEYKGNAALALKAFRSVVATIALLHKDNIVHRDIKPANIFVGKDHVFVLGDFGLVYVPDKAPRITAYRGETVGAGDFIPPWGDIGERLEHVKPSFDVYMLGKVLWCMVAGWPVLKREYFHRPTHDVTKLFPDDPNMYMINVILEHSVVEEEKDCWSSASDLLLVMDADLETIKQGGQLLHEGIPRICHVCGVGRYERLRVTATDPISYSVRLWKSGGATDISSLGVELWECGLCHHIELFRTNPPR
jgi:serine/threonine protein kinase